MYLHGYQVLRIQFAFLLACYPVIRLLSGCYLQYLHCLKCETRQISSPQRIPGQQPGMQSSRGVRMQAAGLNEVDDVSYIIALMTGTSASCQMTQIWRPKQRMNSDVSVSFISMKLILLIDVPIPAMLPLTEDTQSPCQQCYSATVTDINILVVY